MCTRLSNNTSRTDIDASTVPKREDHTFEEGLTVTPGKHNWPSKVKSYGPYLVRPSDRGDGWWIRLPSYYYQNKILQLSVLPSEEGRINIEVKEISLSLPFTHLQVRGPSSTVPHRVEWTISRAKTGWRWGRGGGLHEVLTSRYRGWRWGRKTRIRPDTKGGTTC